MGTIAQKIHYTKTWIDDIEVALQERGIDTSSLALEHYGEAIRGIQGGGDGGGNPLACYDRINNFKIISPKSTSTENDRNHYDDIGYRDIEISISNNYSLEDNRDNKEDKTIEVSNYQGYTADFVAYSLDDILT